MAMTAWSSRCAFAASLGVLPHASGLYAHLTGRENIRYYGKLHGLHGAELDRLTDELIERLGLGAVAGRRAKGYSQGERLKVALARALVHQPRTVILDEPTNGLDVNAVRMLRELIRQLRAAGRCVLFSSHVMQEVAALCDDIVDHLARPRRRTRHACRDSRRHWRGGSRGSVRARRRRRSAGMTRATRIVFAKEMLENLRDRRVIMSAFLFGVLLAPVIFGLTTSFTSKRVVESQDKPLRLTVAGAEHAANLVHFLEENGAEIKATVLTPDEAMSAVRAGGEDLVLLIGADYAGKLQAGEPAPLDLVTDTANNQTRASAERARRLLEAYGRQLASLRLLVRGISAEVIHPVDVRTLDVATPAGRSLLILGMMTYFSFMSLLVGGFYLAIDTTAGERERGSLEPLLSLPVRRAELLVGKMLATSAFMSISLLLTLAAFGVVLQFIPLEALGMSANFGPGVVLAIFAVMLPFVPLGAGLMTAVASFTRSNREAQSWLSVVMLLPSVPIMFAVVNSTKPTAALMTIPSLSQHLLATSLMRGDAIPRLHVLISAGTTLALGALLVLIAIRLYQREAILG